ncbi:membrane protein YdbS with pleckstrin-like domain [Trueperella bonasi]|uniref:Membrane protein YdbS with pleckstrin-like domain n=1 Tax=Trueperella bonasi TaxID=312286 RepID=A0ABT9NHP2_9ACTO|nr:DUF998 domain-containing protein [Trueperella bonasi]MDP9806914.1 membrane protein YdbS with pleckstrin-like domain [Trueperella bonasi]
MSTTSARPVPKPVALTLAAVVVVAYNTWMLSPALPGNSALMGYLSELAAKDQPWNWFYRAGDMMAAVAVCTVAALGWSAWQTWLGRWSRWMALSVGAIGAFTAIDAVFAMPCATTSDAACKARETANFFAPEFFIHTAASMAVGFAIAASLFVGCWATRERFVLALTAIILLAFAVTGILSWWPGRWHGAPQAVQVAFTSVWLAYLAWRLQWQVDENEPADLRKSEP